jgi:polyisoprenoid-binding protein YceI
VLTAAETAGTYSVDPAHTNVGFRVRHMGLAIILGEFTDHTATISYDPNDITKSSVQFTAKVASLDTGVKQRDDHLRGADYAHSDHGILSEVASQSILSWNQIVAWLKEMASLRTSPA